MKPCLADVNVWLALLVASHDHHRLASSWYRNLQPAQAGMPRMVQLGLVRLLSNRSVLAGSALTTPVAWNVVSELFEDERVEFLPEPDGIDRILRGFLHYPAATPKLLNDAYLASFAVTASRTLVTLDRGFAQFPGLVWRSLLR
ncbi:MAG: VapC toxin family PIN domain ribonuclease [Acidobacteria bacterium]|nr:VapC toxin family PIN domain ribonuclease [Acidobacteriota bacterium]